MALATLVRSDGKTFAYGDIYRILSYGLTGVGTLQVEIFSESRAAGDGDVVTGQRLPPRSIGIQAVCTSRAANSRARAIANGFFNPLYEYELHLDYRGVRAWIPCLLEVFDLPTGNLHQPQALNVSLFCPDPYFLSESAYGRNIAQVTGMLGWPYMDHPSRGRVVSAYNFSRAVVIENGGDVTTWPRVEITARGEVVRPRIEKDGLFVAILDTLQAGDALVLDFAAKTVTKNGVNIIQRMSRDSSFTSIAFAVGPNLIGYGAASGENVMSCYIYYNERYVGV